MLAGIPIELLTLIGGAVLVILLKRMGIEVPFLEASNDPVPDSTDKPTVKNEVIESIVQSILTKVLGNYLGKTPEETHKNIQELINK